MNLRRLHRGSTRSSAAVARERLLKDRTLRRNRFQAPPVATLPFSAPLAMPPRGETPPTDAHTVSLSPYAQKWHIIATARHFRGHYLAEMAYDDRRHITVAVICPYFAQAQAGEAPFEIRVDGKGHTTIVRLERKNDSQKLFIFRRVLVALLLAAALTGGALALFP